MANRIKYNLALQISKQLGDVKFTSKSFKALRKDDKLLVRLSTDDVHLPERIKSVCDDLHGIERVEVKQAGDYKNINFFVDKNHLIKTTVAEAIDPIPKESPETSRMVIEYSSPNIAKPFHVGHLRSTIIGNFISNVNIYLGEDVTRLNYLGDWGTQFGMLKVGIDLCNFTQEQIKNDPLKYLNMAYVKANKLAGEDNSINIKARQVFNELEKGNQEYMKEWNDYRKYTLNELKHTYSRLCVTFDEYHWESMYSSSVIKSIIDNLEKRGVVRTDDEGRKVAILENKKTVPIAKSDGSSLYLGRDIAAILDRHAKYNFHEMLYVVDNSQNDHFKSLFGIINQTYPEIGAKCKHVQFGRVQGMSTRKGTVVLLSDILDEAANRMHEKRKSSKYTKGKLCDTTVSENLGVTSILVYDLKQRRTRGYEFSWDHALQDVGNTGNKLQYTHCRLHSMEQNCGVFTPARCDPNLLPEPEATFLILELAKFDQIVREARRDMEPCILVLYLFTLCNLINAAFGKLRVKDQPTDVAEQRLLLFSSAKMVLKRGLELLGIVPLNEM